VILHFTDTRACPWWSVRDLPGVIGERNRRKREMEAKVVMVYEYDDTSIL
jgi:hypothetical protein